MNCGKCHGSFEKEGRDPLLLPSCGHTLCRSCLRLFTKHNGFKCIFCGVKQPKVNLSDLQPNYALLDIIASMNDENGLPGKMRERHRSKVRTPAGGDAADKDRGRDESILRNTENECRDHEGVRLTYWCGACGVAACGECVVEKHSEEAGGRRHRAERIDVSLKTRRSELEDLVCEVTNALDTAEEKRTTFAKSSPFIAGAKKLYSEVGVVWGKMKIVASLLACLIQESENGDSEIRKLRQWMDKLIQKAPPASPTAAGNIAELRALLKHLQRIENFRDGAVAKVLKEVDEVGKEDRQNFLSSASVHTAVLNVKATTLCRQVVCYGEGCQLEVVCGSGLVGSLTRNDNKLHCHCFRRPSVANPRKPASDPSRLYGLKWAILQTQMDEVNQVFVVLAKGVKGQAGSVSDRVYWKLCRPDSTTTTTITNETAFHRFLHLVMGDDGTNSLLDSLTGEVQQLLSGVRVILLGTHHQEEEEGEEKSKEGVTKDTTNMTDSHVTSNASNATITLTAGDVMCVKGRQRKGDAEFWLVTDTTTRTAKSFVDCEVVGKLLLPAHKSLQTRLASLKGRKVEDCGVVLSIESEVMGAARAPTAAPSARVSPSVVHIFNTAEVHKPQRYNGLDEFS